MQTLIIRSLLFNLAALLLSGSLLLWYPKNSGFTITTRTETHYIAGGEFLGATLICLADLALAAYLGWRIWHPR